MHNLINFYNEVETSPLSRATTILTVHTIIVIRRTLETVSNKRNESQSWQDKWTY